MPAQIKSLARRTTNGVWVNHLYLQHNDPPSSRLMVILPGQGYTAEHPVLYYLRKMALSLNYDVLSVQYSFQAAPHEISPSDIGWHSLLREVSQAVESVMHPGYTDICFAGKSLGTPLAVQQAQAYSKVNA